MTEPASGSGGPSSESQSRFVTRKALISRVNRKLAHEGKILRSKRGRGDYIVEIKTGTIVTQDVDLEKLANELDCLRSGEKFES